MLNVLKVLLSLAGEHRLKFSMTQIEHLIVQLITALIIGMFLTTLVTIAVAVGAFGLYQILIMAGLISLLSAVVVGIILLLLIGLCAHRLAYYTMSIKDGINRVAHFENPVVGPVVGQLSNVAQSFVSGLMQSQPKKKPETPVAPEPEPDRPRISLVQSRSL